ncbi:MAG: hypothetical protein IPH28_03675 [Cytophagaceae bacterium]|nr:hypothetical protein [Cytophagaceae bacterium]MBK9509421.1 hypothetical protein [Cytophagaceae bacterium]MBK9935151.1 hypothetical protein [Cytophagaceae bacterium]MBL0301595.1 hypothetical protein [Cytophagaceae bacterium]MBL0324419.1 hypothetical protein [Cytophagaceae bacterium]
MNLNLNNFQSDLDKIEKKHYKILEKNHFKRLNMIFVEHSNPSRSPNHILEPAFYKNNSELFKIYEEVEEVYQKYFPVNATI